MSIYSGMRVNCSAEKSPANGSYRPYRMSCGADGKMPTSARDTCKPSPMIIRYTFWLILYALASNFILSCTFNYKMEHVAKSDMIGSMQTHIGERTAHIICGDDVEPIRSSRPVRMHNGRLNFITNYSRTQLFT